MHVRVRTFGKPDLVVVVESKLTKIDQFRRIIKDKFDVEPKLQQLFYGGKLLEDGYTFYDYNIKLNEVIQLVVKLQTEETTERNQLGNGIKKEDKEAKEKDYRDACSPLYLIGDLVDIRDQVHGTWLEGKIVRIFYDPDSPVPVGNVSTPSLEKSNEENKSPNEKMSGVNGVSPSKSKKKCITHYFNKSPKRDIKETEVKLLYKVQLDDEEESNDCCEVHNIRPRARTVLDVENLKEGQKVMINYNIDEPLEKGYWYDFKVDKIKKLRKTYELSGTLYLGTDSVPQNDTKVKVLDKIFAIEEVVPVAQRTAEQQRNMLVKPEKRSTPLKCLTCLDDEDKPCQDCGCYLCYGKEKPDKIVLCDDCDYGYHMDCLDPPLSEVPDDEWYCPLCKMDANEVIAPGAAKQKKKTNASKSKRDWGRGMACVGKTKSSMMPANHFGPIPGIEVGMCWRFRIQLSETGVHRPPVSGIHGRDVEGAYSIVLSGGYEDDVDNGNEFTYTGSGGRDLSGNKRTAEQSCDQTLTRENKALARNCALSQISEKGGDAGVNWRNGKPVRVVRSYKMLKHFPKYAPKEGIRYDGIYKVVKYYPEKGLSGYRVWKYLLRRDDPNPAPWEPNATQYPIIYPDGYLEAEAEKKAQKQKRNKNGKGNKRVLRKSNMSESECEPSPPTKKKKTASKEETQTKINNRSSKDKNALLSPKKSPKKLSKKNVESALSPNAKNAIKADKLNCKLWDESLEVLKEEGKKKFMEHVAEVFLCIICQSVAVRPVTTPCLHNFCMACINLAFKTTGSQTCPCCREKLSKVKLQPNDQLKAALQTIMTGYDAGK